MTDERLEMIEYEKVSAMKAPFPWFGGKSKVAGVVWERFGNVPNYVEPFFGSGAVCLARPRHHWNATSIRAETVNDLDGYLANFWRAIKHAPNETAEHACYPVSEVDILARHKWLLTEGAARLELLNMRENPDAYDAKVAGWWVWGLACWLGGGWCVKEAQQIPHLGDAGQGVIKKLPYLGDAGRGVIKRLPYLGDAGRGDLSAGLKEWFSELSERFMRVRIAHGDWSRVLSKAVTINHGVTAVFLDPPYSSKEHSVEYSAGGGDVAADVRAWAIANGDNPQYRIALCGYEGEHEMPGNWEVFEWKTGGGFGNLGCSRGKANSYRERIWFSPYCEQAGLF